MRPVYAEAQVGLARTYLALEKPQLAKPAVLKSIQLDPRNADLHSMLGRIYTEIANPVMAESGFRQALELNPNCNDALLGLGHLQMENGQLGQAEELFRKAIELGPYNVQAMAQLAQVRKVGKDDGNFVSLQEIEGKIDELSEHNAIVVHFALGKCYDDVGEPEHAFPHFLSGCQLKRRQITYNPEHCTRQVNALMQIFNKETITRLRHAGNTSSVPIFVLGMPRSGTTLTEQIIASHPEVHGAGELGDLLRVTGRTVSGNTKPANFPNNLRTLNQEVLVGWGSDYLAALRRHAPEAPHITDKMPANFLAIGLIHLMLPNAKIIHVRRNPVDTCLSCFTHLFSRNLQAYTYDLAELGKYYVDYARLMDHWRSVMPAGAFLEVQYEDIVADQETQARRLIEYCGLAWNDACLNFHETKRPVRTSSLTQVRQPIYTSSVARWRPYENYLGPLLDALGDLVTDRGFVGE